MEQALHNSKWLMLGVTLVFSGVCGQGLTVIQRRIKTDELKANFNTSMV